MFRTNHKGKTQMEKYKRMNEHRILFGNLSGLAYILELPAWIVRTAFCMFCFFAGPIVCSFFSVLYFLVGLLTPEYEQDPTDYKAVCE